MLFSMIVMTCEYVVV